MTQARATPISAEPYLRKEIFKTNGSQTDAKLKEFIDCFALLNQCEHLND